MDFTPSPTSPYGASEQGNFGDPANSRRRLVVQSRPFSELYSEEFVPLDDDGITSPELSRNSQVTNNENTLSGNDSTNLESVGDNRTSSSLATSNDIESPESADETIDQGDDSQNVLDNTDGISSLEASATLTPGPEENNQDLENQPMEIPEESNDVNTSEVEMILPGAGQRSSVGSIELTEDSPLRILEENERVREERSALSRENLLLDPTAESDDELEQMDVTDETIAERDSSHNSDYSMEDALASGNVTQSALNESNSEETQLMAERETDLLEAASNGLLDEEVDDSIVPPVQEREGSRASPVSEHLPGPSSLIETETEAGEMTAAEESLQQPSENSEHGPVEQQEISERDEPMSLLEYVDQIIVGETTEQNGDNAMIIESVGDSTQVGTSSTGSSVGTSEAADPSAVDSSCVAIPSVTLPMEASEPVCLDATSLQSASTSEMIVDTPSANFTVQSRVGNGDSASPQRPPRGKRVSRSSSEPRSTHSRRHAERTRNASRGSNQGENSARQSRPPLIRRVTEPTTMQTNVVNPAVVPVNTGALSQASNTMAAVATPVAESVTDSEVLSPTESVVMAVPLSPPPQRDSSSSAPSPVVVADVVAEAAALVTPLPSPDRTNSTSDDQSTVVAVSSEAIRRDESTTSRDSPDDYVMIVPSESRQPSSAPSTLRRGDVVSAVASLLSNETGEVQHRRNLSQDNSPSVIYATPLSGVSRELTDQQSASFPRQSSTARVTALSGNRRRSSSSSSGYTVSRAVSEESQSLPRNYGHTVVSNPPAAVVTASATLNSEQSRPNTAERVNNNSSHGASSLPGPSSQSGSDLNQSREAIQTMLRSYYINSTQAPGGQPPPVRPPRASTTSAQEPEAARRPSQPNQRNGNRRSSGRRQQGNPVHVAIQDQQQTREQQARQGQQASEEEPLPPSKKSEGCFI